MKKQAKPDLLKEQASDATPVVTTSEGQAPVLPFAPYSHLADGPFEEPGFSPTLVEKSNELARKIWNNPQGYAFSKRASYYFPENDAQRAVHEVNKAHFDHYYVAEYLRRAFSIERNYSEAQSWNAYAKIKELVKKLKRLEKKHEWDDIINEDTRERLINTVLVPSHLYGASDGMLFGTMYFSMTHPVQKSVVNGLIVQDDVEIIEDIINFIPRVREIMRNFSASLTAFSTEDVLVKLSKDSVSQTDLQQMRGTLETHADVLKTLKILAQFFNSAIPLQVSGDLIPELQYPTKSTAAHGEMVKASTELRNAVLGYVSEGEPLSSLLQKILDLRSAMFDYFMAIVMEVTACFNFLNRMEIPFDKFVEESKERIDASLLPW